MKIDSHVHLGTPTGHNHQVVEKVRKSNDFKNYKIPFPLVCINEFVKKMDQENKIDGAVIFGECFPVRFESKMKKFEERNTFHSLTEKIKNNFGKTLFPFVVIGENPNDQKELDATEKALKEQRFFGIKISQTSYGNYPDDPILEPVYEILKSTNHLIAICHLSTFEDGASIENIIKVAKKYPEINFVGAHMGSAKNAEKVFHTVDQMWKNRHLENIFLDTSVEYPTLEEIMGDTLKKIGDMDRIVAASDFPFFEFSKIEEIISSAAKDANLNTRQIELILGNKMAELLGINN